MPRKYERPWTSPEHSPEEELAGWIEMHIVSPFQQQFLHATMSEDNCISEKVRTMDDLSLAHTRHEDNGKPLPQADVETATLQPKEGAA